MSNNNFKHLYVRVIISSMNYTQKLRKRRQARSMSTCCGCGNSCSCVGECTCGINSSPLKKQKLSASAAKKKAVRDKRYAMSEWGKYKKRTAQRAKCKKGYDFDHSIGKNGKCVKKSANRARNSRSGKVQSKYKGKY